jgi:hypothetical protein
MKDELAVYSSDVHPRQAIGSAIYIYTARTHTQITTEANAYTPEKRERERENLKLYSSQHHVSECCCCYQRRRN